MNEAIRIAAGRLPPEPEPAPPDPDTPPAFPDLGQGQRGTSPAPEPLSGGEWLRGIVRGRRRIVAEEIEEERRARR